MNEVINKMYQRKSHPYSKSISQKFLINSEHYDTIIIVEGTSDVDFYKNSNIEILNNACYIFASPNADIVGKKAVIKSYFEIKEQSRKHIFNNSIIFIVDKDFFGINWKAPEYKKIAIEEKATTEDIDNFTILNCHSHECYFILEENLTKIFNLLHIEDKLNDFNKILEYDLEDFSEYFAYKSILEKENPYYSKDCENIKGIDFKFEFKENNITYDKESLTNAIKKMKREVEYSENKKILEKQYLEMKQNFKLFPGLLRGHTMYSFLECFLNHNGKSLKEYYEDEGLEYNNEIMKSINIPLDIKVLKVNIGKYKTKETI